MERNEGVTKESQIWEKHLYTHFKGTTYIVHGIGVHTETGEKLVVYQKWECGRCASWTPLLVRPVSQFLEPVKNGARPATARFSYCDYSNNLPEDPDWR